LLRFCTALLLLLVADSASAICGYFDAPAAKSSHFSFPRLASQNDATQSLARRHPGIDQKIANLLIELHEVPGEILESPLIVMTHAVAEFKALRQRQLTEIAAMITTYAAEPMIVEALQRTIERVNKRFSEEHFAEVIRRYSNRPLPNDHPF